MSIFDIRYQYLMCEIKIQSCKSKSTILSADYWDSKKRNDCPVLDDSKGITLRSLGGIFLATLCGLLLSLITLAYEMWQQKREEKKGIVAPSGGEHWVTLQFDVFFCLLFIQGP